MAKITKKETDGLNKKIHEYLLIKDEMKKAGALNAMMSGSGPTVFGIFESRAAARRAQEQIRRKALAKQVYVTNVHGARRT